MPPPTETTALALFSGGLDSILACRVMMAQNIRVRAIRFVTPFFNENLLTRRDDYIRETKEKYNIDVDLMDVTAKYLELLRNPAHGFGKNFNPCVDCKILLFSEARALMPRYHASFLITGEVVGQRPMSQRRDTLRIIERDSGCENLLVRPLCALGLEPTAPELAGLINRNKLRNLSGRSRSGQMALAKELGISDYPSPAGGCILTDPVLSKRIHRYYDSHAVARPEDIRLLLVGRQFHLPGNTWVVVGRTQAENDRIDALHQAGDWLLTLKNRPGPTALLRPSAPPATPADLRLAAGLVRRYAKNDDTVDQANEVEALCQSDAVLITDPPEVDQAMRDWFDTPLP